MILKSNISVVNSKIVYNDVEEIDREYLNDIHIYSNWFDVYGYYYHDRILFLDTSVYDNNNNDDGLVEHLMYMLREKKLNEIKI